MRKGYVIAFSLFCYYSVFSQGGDPPAFPPPFHFKIDSVSLLATWQNPKIVLLDEDFEGEAFPPAGWNTSSLGAGWNGVESPDYYYWKVPYHSGRFALTNDDSASYSNPGSLDFLITPPLDLTVADSFRLVFDSYFDAGYGEAALVKYSVDGGMTWDTLLNVPAYLYWKTLTVDLSEFSGEGGQSSFQLLFHADDRGYYASGWAVDDVRVLSDALASPSKHFELFFGNRQIAQVQDTFYFSFIPFDTVRSLGVVAVYDEGSSDTIWQEVHSAYLAPPKGLAGCVPEDSVILFWGNPTVPIHPYARDIFDSLYCFPTAAVQTEGGCHSDGEYVYSFFENSDSIYKYDFFGNIMGKFRIPGIPGLCDLAFVPEEDCFYGSNGTTTLYKFDLNNQTLLGTYTLPFIVRGLAYDENYGYFWGNNWSTDLIMFDLSGTVLNTIPVYGLGNFSSLVYDKYLIGGPYLFAFSRDGNGKTIIAIQVETGQQTWQIDIGPMSVSNGLSGGLYICMNYHYGSMVLGGNLLNDVFFGIEHSTSVMTGFIPENLLGFNIYRDGQFIGYQEGHAPPWLVNEYMDCLPPEVCYASYEITGAYDMGPYGHPGDTMESKPAGPAMISGCLWWLELDFSEDWSSGSFDEHLWRASDSAWHVSPDMGNGPPAAVFYPDTVLTDYSESITSWQFLTTGYPAPRFDLSFDLRLSSMQPSGQETLEVQVYDFISESWNPVGTYSNIDGSFDWIRDTIDITNKFNEDSFKIRFVTCGENSSDIEYWAVDNISITYHCLPPDSLLAELTPPPGDSIRVTWEEPSPEIAEWREWDDGVFSSKIGLGVSKYEWFGFAIRWTPEQMQELKNARITAVGIIPGEVSAFFKLSIWTGEERKLRYEQATGVLEKEEWNVIYLDEPFKIDITNDLLVGFQFAEYICCPLSVDNGPAIDGYGNLFYGVPDQEWQTLLELNPECDFNWNIKAFFEKEGNSADNYEVYRNIDGGEFQLIAQPEAEEYLDPLPPGSATYCYAVKAVYYGGFCTSEFSNESCLAYVSSDPLPDTHEHLLQIVPNPSDGVFTLISSEKIIRICLYTISGEILLEEDIDGFHSEVHLDDLQPGVYLIKVISSHQNFVKKLVIIH